MKKQFIFLFSLLFLVFLISSVSAQVWNDIYNCQELQYYIRQDMDGNFRLINNIDCSNTTNWYNATTGYYGFQPIGYGESIDFTGVLDGNGYYIYNLYQKGFNNGIFERVGDATIKNLPIINSTYYGCYGGGLFTENYDGTYIFNVSITGNMYYNASVCDLYYWGGIGGYTANSQDKLIISTSYTDIDMNRLGQSSVNDTAYIGGLFGHLSNGVITNSYSAGNLIGSTRIGGLVGSCQDCGIYDSYYKGIIVVTNLSYSTSYGIGGLVGQIYNDSFIFNSYANNQFFFFDINNAECYGGLVGCNKIEPENNPEIIGSFWNTDLSELYISYGGEGKTTSQMKNINTYLNAGWDIATISNWIDETWKINNLIDYPFLATITQEPNLECIIDWNGISPYRKYFPLWNNTYDLGGWTGIEAYNFSIHTRYANYNKIQVGYWDDEFYGMVYLTLDVPLGSPDIASGTLYAGLFNYLTTQKLTIKTNNKEYYSTFWLNISNPCGYVEDSFNVNITLFPVPPIIIGNFSDYYNLDNYTEEEPLSLYMKDYFSSYYYLPTYWGYYTQITAEFQGKNWTINNTSPNYFCDTSTNLEICFSKVGGDVKDLRLIFYSQNITTNNQMKITASNEFGNISQTFYLFAEGGEYVGEGFFGRIVNLVGRMFPSYLTLTMRERFGYMFVTMFVATIILLAVSGSFKDGIKPISVILSILVNLLTFIFFIAIKYVSIGQIILFAIIMGLVGFGFRATKT